MENFEAEQERKKKERESAAQEDGWTVVKRHKVRSLSSSLAAEWLNRPAIC